MATKDKIEKLEDLIKGTIGGELVEQKTTALLPPGENYGSVMYKVDFKVKKDGKVKDYHAVAKCTPLNEMTQEFFNTQETFKSEIAWYTIVIPTLKQFAKDQGLERELDYFQEFYGARISLNPKSDRVDLDGVILTENLKYRGYNNIDRHIGFDAPTTFSILKDLAAFHAVPLAIRVKNPALFEAKLKPYCPTLPAMESKMKEKTDEMLFDVFNYIPEMKPYIERVKKTVSQSYPFAQKEIRDPWATIIHLDFWCNNIMVTGGKDSKNIILDLQVPMVGSPASDLVFFLLTSVQFSIVEDQFDEFVKFYYDEFIKNLKALKVDANDFEFKNFLKEINTEARNSEYTHALGHTLPILADKGTTAFDSSDANFSAEKMEESLKPAKPNERQIEKFKWITLEALKRNWI